MKRREFLKVAGSSVAGLAFGAALLDSCSKGGGTIITKKRP